MDRSRIDWGTWHMTFPACHIWEWEGISPKVRVTHTFGKGLFSVCVCAFLYACLQTCFPLWFENVACLHNLVPSFLSSIYSPAVKNFKFCLLVSLINSTFPFLVTANTCCSNLEYIRFTHICKEN